MNDRNDRNDHSDDYGEGRSLSQVNSEVTCLAIIVAVAGFILLLAWLAGQISLEVAK